MRNAWAELPALLRNQYCKPAGPFADATAGVGEIMKLTCQNCGSVFFHDDKRTMYCSKQCRAAYQDKNKTKTAKACLICGKEFEAKASQVCCSIACKEVRRKEIAKEYNHSRFSSKTERLDDSIKNVVINAWRKADSNERAIIEFHNQDLRFI